MAITDFGASPSVLTAAMNSSPKMDYSPLSEVFEYRADMESKNLRNETQRLQLDEIKKGLAEAPKSESHRKAIINKAADKLEREGKTDAAAFMRESSNTSGPDLEAAYKIAASALMGETKAIDGLAIAGKVKRIADGFTNGDDFVSAIESGQYQSDSEKDAALSIAKALAPSVDKKNAPKPEKPEKEDKPKANEYTLPDGSKRTAQSLLSEWAKEYNIPDAIEIKFMARTDPKAAQQMREQSRLAKPYATWAKEKYKINIYPEDEKEAETLSEDIAAIPSAETKKYTSPEEVKADFKNGVIGSREEAMQILKDQFGATD